MQAKRTQGQRQAIRKRGSLHTFLCGWPRGCRAVHALSCLGPNTPLEDFMHHSSPRHRPVSKVRQLPDSVPAQNMQQSELYGIHDVIKGHSPWSLLIHCCALHVVGNNLESAVHNHPWTSHHSGEQPQVYTIKTQQHPWLQVIPALYFHQ